ncbi:MAG: carboxypeptidase regulatory-like domain-containing protein [Spirochaetaceae bacterium]|nr:carboxypeptidase regulatory-like domain-containing protein [Spirochaetaceae bacterium]
MKHLGPRLLPFLGMLALLFACATAGPLGFRSGEALHGMVYAKDGRPLGGVTILCQGRPVAESDSQGRFAFPPPARADASATVQFSKPGYERVSAELRFADRSQVLHARLRSGEDLLAESLELHSQGCQAESRALAAAALEADQGLAAARFLMAALRYRAGEHQEALAALDALRAGGVDHPFCDLLEADIAEYGLRDWRRAAAALGRFLSVRDDPGVERRLEVLVGAAQDPANDGQSRMGAEP